MDNDKIRQLEAKLREMLDADTDGHAPAMEETAKASPPRKVVIRRRKGQQDKRISLG